MITQGVTFGDYVYITVLRMLFGRCPSEFNLSNSIQLEVKSWVVISYNLQHERPKKAGQYSLCRAFVSGVAATDDIGQHLAKLWVWLRESSKYIRADSRNLPHSMNYGRGVAPLKI